MRWQRLQRLIRHRWIDDDAVRWAVPPRLLQRLEAHIASSERLHSGEICIHVEAGLPWSYLWREASARERALAMFGKLRVWDTEQNNGVLIYLLLADRAVEIVADRGLRSAVADSTWGALIERMGRAFRDGHLEQGLLQAVDEVSALLVQHFALEPGQRNPNELPDAPGAPK